MALLLNPSRFLMTQIVLFWNITEENSSPIKTRKNETSTKTPVNHNRQLKNGETFEVKEDAIGYCIVHSCVLTLLATHDVPQLFGQFLSEHLVV